MTMSFGAYFTHFPVPPFQVIIAQLLSAALQCLQTALCSIKTMAIKPLISIPKTLAQCLDHN